jgi:serine/threonine protein kinase
LRPTGDDESRVDGLLSLIASQSHFEERYEVRETLASGGMGKVLRAFDRVLRREVAVKMMRDELASSPANVRGQFLKEARVGGRLLHPNILAVFDLGVNKLGRIYYTMRLVDGASLHHCLEALGKGAVTKLITYPLRRVVESLVGVCQGIDYAHQNGVCHLDLKPQNILVSGFNEVFVIDWGLAKIDDINDTEELADLYRSGSNSSDTATASKTVGGAGRVVGTPGYMAPEQVRGEFHCFDATTDVYGLGGVLFFILYGESPNRGRRADEIMAASCQPKQRGKLREGILPRGRRVNKEARSAIDALEAVCLKALEVDPKDRYPNVEAMLVELSEWLLNTPALPLGF